MGKQVYVNYFINFCWIQNTYMENFFYIEGHEL